MEPKYDWRGTEIKRGSRILYVVAHSSSVELVEADVIDIQEVVVRTNFGRKSANYQLIVSPTRRNQSGWTREDDGTSRTITAVERVTVIEQT